MIDTSLKAVSAEARSPLNIYCLTHSVINHAAMHGSVWGGSLDGGWTYQSNGRDSFVHYINNRGYTPYSAISMAVSYRTSMWRSIYHFMTCYTTTSPYTGHSSGYGGEATTSSHGSSRDRSGYGWETYDKSHSKDQTFK